MGQAADFVADLYGAQFPDGLLAEVWERGESKKTTHYLSGPSDANKFEKKSTIYIAASLVDRDRGPHRRHTQKESSAIAGVWADVDLPGPEDPPTKKPAPTRKAALDLVTSILEPTLLVNSGYGIQAWWLFDEVWLLGDDEFERAAQITRGWQSALRQNALSAGFALDATHDLNRLMRLPGTLNTKGGKSVPVELLEREGPRYALEGIAEPSLAAAPTPGLRTTDVTIELGLEVPHKKLSVLLEESEEFAATLNHARKDAAQKGWSTSHYDLALASFAVHAGWGDSEVAALIAHHRRKYNGESDDKAGREDYLKRTISRAKMDINREELHAQQERAVDELAEMGESISTNGKTPDPDVVYARWTEVVGGGLSHAPKFREFIQYGKDADTARFAFRLEDDEEINVGPFENLMNPSRLANRLAPTTGFVMKALKADERWRSALRPLMQVRQIREGDESHPVIEYTRRYVQSHGLALQPDDAASEREPFQKEGAIYIRLDGLAHFIRQALRENIDKKDLPRQLENAGFRTTSCHYYKDGRRSSTKYWSIAGDLIE